VLEGNASPLPQPPILRRKPDSCLLSGNSGDIGAPDGIWFFTLKILPQKMGKFVVSVGNCGYSMALASTLKTHGAHQFRHLTLTKGSLLSE
jgi:hypothetical protein